MNDHKQLLETIAGNIKAIRKDRGLTQEQLSELCRIKQSHISKIESGNQSLQLDTISTISNALDVPTRQLLVPNDPRQLLLLEKLACIEDLPLEERQAIERVIDMALLSIDKDRTRSEELDQLSRRGVSGLDRMKRYR